MFHCWPWSQVQELLIFVELLSKNNVCSDNSPLSPIVLVSTTSSPLVWGGRNKIHTHVIGPQSCGRASTIFNSPVSVCCVDNVIRARVEHLAHHIPLCVCEIHFRWVRSCEFLCLWSCVNSLNSDSSAHSRCIPTHILINKHLFSWRSRSVYVFSGFLWVSSVSVTRK